MKATPPFVRMIIPLVAGIVAVNEFYDRHWFTTDSLSFFMLLILLGGAGVLFFSDKKPLLRSFLVVVLLVFLGALTTTLKKRQFEKEVVQIASEEYSKVLIRVTSLGEKRKKALRFEGTVVSLRTPSGWKKVDSRILFSVALTDTFLFVPGSLLLAEGSVLKRPAKALNPGEFNYQSFLEKKGIAWTAFLPADSYRLLFKPTTLALTDWPLQSVGSVEDIFLQQLSDPKTFGLVKSMLLGRRDDLGSDLLNSYVVSGTVHVLSVSGLHVGILFVLLAWLLGGLKRNKGGRFLYAAVVVTVLLMYAIITGLSPSVLRATMMCLIWVAAELVNRKHSSINTLAISAFVLLLIDPLSLYSVGFQLSYAAVLGILLFYPLFKDLYKGSNRLVKWIWQVSLVGFSAQLLTFPISIYYFHQFPTYFWLVNPLVIFLTSGLIYSALGLLVVSFLPFSFLTWFVAYLVQVIAVLTNTIVEFPQKLPFYLFQTLYLDLVEVFLLFAGIFMVYQVLASREFKYLKRMGGVVLVFACYSVGTNLSESNTPQVLFHAIPRHTVLTYSKGTSAHILCDPSFQLDTLSYEYYLKNYFLARGVRKVEFHELANNQRNVPELLRIEKDTLGFDASDYSNRWVVIRAKKYPQGLAQEINKGVIYLLSPELGFKTRKQWENILTQRDSPFYNPMESGAIKLP